MNKNPTYPFVKKNRRIVDVQTALRFREQIIFPEGLPVSSEREKICDLIHSSQVVVICGETGSGKTTQLPKMCLSLGRGWGAGGQGLIGHTQPRRIAATSTAKRIAQELNSALGEVVGYKIRFQDKLSETASIKLMTDGILLAETQADPFLKKYDTIIIDEAHERSLNIDFLLGYIKEILPSRPDLKIIITSATIDAERFSVHFGGAPVINVSGRTYPVEQRYRPIQADEKDKERDLYDGITDAVDELAREGDGDILVFLPGEREIREAAEVLRKHHPAYVEVLPLFARLTALEQEKIFKPSNARRIILATNVAETSLTVPGIRYVVDSGLARVKRYSYRQKVEQLYVESISKAAANQRAGRCGRVASGVCIRLYSEDDFNGRADFTDPEIMRSSLASVILRMKALGLKSIEDFPFVQAPLNRAIVDGYHLLQELGAVDDKNQLTQIGKSIAKLPIDPKIARMILAAKNEAALREVLIIASALSVQDVRDRPVEFRTQADSAHAKFNEASSEFVAYLKIWQWFESALAHKKSHRQLQELCRANFLSFMRLREWRDVHLQVSNMVKELGWRINDVVPTHEQLHCALLSGLMGNIGYKNDKITTVADKNKLGQRQQYYLGARGIQFYLWPGTSLSKKNSQWLMAAELVDTSRLFARVVAKIEPSWLEKVGKHLLKKTYSEPRWRKRSGQVQADERATLYGLVVYSQRPVSYARIDASLAREIFIRDGVAAHEIEGRFPFIKHNSQLIAQIESIEHKSRRQDVLVDDELIVAFYDSVIPKEITDVRQLQKWHDEIIKNNAKILYFSRDELMRHEASGVTTDVFPKTIKIGGVDCALSYHFEPNAPRDGVTLTVPVFLLNQISAHKMEWLVAGMVKPKIYVLLKSLPQKLRKSCVPLPEYTDDFMDWALVHNKPSSSSLLDALIEYYRLKTQVLINHTDFKVETLPAHSFMNFKLIDEHGRQLEMSRHLDLLRTHFGGQARSLFQEAVSESSTLYRVSGSGAITSWSFGDLPELMELEKNGKKMLGYPALEAHETHCELSVWDEDSVAREVHENGVLCLAKLQISDRLRQLEKHIPDAVTMGILYTTLTGESLEKLKKEIITLAFKRAANFGCGRDLPRGAVDFEVILADIKSRIGLIVQEVSRLVSLILTEWHMTNKKINGIKLYAHAYKDINTQLSGLTENGFLTQINYSQLIHYPRYFKGIALRADKLKINQDRDALLMRDISPLLQSWQRMVGEQRNVSDGLKLFRWMLEELRVSLFAQELRTPMPVSIKRLYKVLEGLK